MLQCEMGIIAVLDPAQNAYAAEYQVKIQLRPSHDVTFIIDYWVPCVKLNWTVRCTHCLQPPAIPAWGINSRGRVSGHFKEAVDELVPLPGGNRLVPTPATPTFGPLQVSCGYHVGSCGVGVGSCGVGVGWVWGRVGWVWGRVGWVWVLCGVGVGIMWGGCGYHVGWVWVSCGVDVGSCGVDVGSWGGGGGVMGGGCGCGYHGGWVWVSWGVGVGIMGGGCWHGDLECLSN